MDDWQQHQQARLKTFYVYVSPQKKFWKYTVWYASPVMTCCMYTHILVVCVMLVFKVSQSAEMFQTGSLLVQFQTGLVLVHSHHSHSWVLPKTCKTLQVVAVLVLCGTLWMCIQLVSKQVAYRWMVPIPYIIFYTAGSVVGFCCLTDFIFLHKLPYESDKAQKPYFLRWWMEYALVCFAAFCVGTAFGCVQDAFCECTDKELEDFHWWSCHFDNPAWP